MSYIRDNLVQTIRPFNELVLKENAHIFMKWGGWFTVVVKDTDGLPVHAYTVGLSLHTGHEITVFGIPLGEVSSMIDMLAGDLKSDPSRVPKSLNHFNLDDDTTTYKVDQSSLQQAVDEYAYLVNDHISLTPEMTMINITRDSEQD